MKQISQDSFDEAVKENMEILGLTREEAILETIDQFKTQGVNNMSNVEFNVNNSEKSIDKYEKEVQKEQ